MQNKLFATLITALLVMLMAGSAMCATTYDSSLVLENKDSSTWNVIPNDGISALIEYNSVGETFVWHAVGTAPVKGAEYSLIYYADEPDRFNNWGGSNPGALIGKMDTDLSTGDFENWGSTELNMDLPCYPDANMNISENDYCGAPDNYTHCTGAKLWMVPTAALPDPYPGTGPWAFWSTSGILFETDLITYEDCDEFYPGAPPVATFYIGDGFNNDTIPIMILNATNAGSVDMTLTYNASLVSVTVADGDMDNYFYNAGTGMIRIGAYQGSNPGLDGDFMLVNVTLTVIGTGTDDFGITVTTYKDATPCGRAMPYDVDAGKYCTYMNGDVNGDGLVDIFDAMYIAKYVLLKSGYEDIIEVAADVDGSGTIDIADAGYLARHVIEITGYEDLK